MRVCCWEVDASWSPGSSLLESSLKAVLQLGLRLCFVMPVQAQNWPGWRGLSHFAVAEGHSLPTVWSPTHNVRWQAEVLEDLIEHGANVKVDGQLVKSAKAAEHAEQEKREQSRGTQTR